MVAAGWEDEEENRKLFVVNSSLKSATVTISVCEGEYALPDDLKFSFEDGAELIGQRSENGKRIISVNLKPLGVGVIDWKKENNERK